MEKLTQEQLDNILKKHEQWFRKEFNKAIDVPEGVDRYEELKCTTNPAPFIKGSGINLSGDCADLKNHDLSGLNFKGANLSCARLDGANFEGANLEGVDFTSASLDNANFKNANLKKGDFFDTELSGTIFEKANLEGANLYLCHEHNLNFKEANLMFADLRSVKFKNMDFAGANFTGANLTNANFECANFNGANLKDANLSGVYAFDTNFSGANLEGANLEKIHSYECNLKDVNLTGANLSKGSFERADFTGAKLDGVNLTGASLKDSCFSQTKGLSEEYRRVVELSNISPDVEFNGKSNNVLIDYRIEAAKALDKDHCWSGKETDVKVSQTLFTKGYERHQIHQAINQLSPETAEKTPLEMTKYSQEVTSISLKALSPELKRQNYVRSLGR